VKRTIVMTALFFAVMAPVALAGEHDGGEGLWGETNDQVVTYAGFILIVGFPILILILTLIQQRLEKRKDRRLAAAKARRARADERGGW
jgi:membrane protease YdiL (CAAX protease family)